MLALSFPKSMLFLRKIADNTQANSLANALRRKRFKRFLDLLATLPRPLKILDLGGTQSFWDRMNFTDLREIEIVLLNQDKQPTGAANFTSVVGDARNLSQYSDAHFDIVFSNSVIEHVGSFEDQLKMAKEIQRVGRHYFVQTPAKYFPIEPHFLFPFFAVFPEWLRVLLVRNFNLGWYKKIPQKEAAKDFLHYFRLLTFGEMRQLFPTAKLIKEKFFGITKSYIVVA